MVYRLRLKPAFAVEYMGGAVRAITGRTRDEFYADPAIMRMAVHPDDAERLVGPMHRGDQRSRVATIRWVHPDGRIVSAEHRSVPVLDGGRLVAIEGTARDVTEQLAAQQELHGSREQMRRLAARVESAREDERTTLARELHDELGQSLTAMKMELMRANAVFRKNRLQPKTVDRLQSLIGLTEIAIATVKRISTDLRPPALDHLGLAEAIRWEGVTFRARTGLRCRVRARREGTRLTPDQQTIVFRIFQEALTNVVRHARASAVQVSLTEQLGCFELQVRDNGRGITPAQGADPKAIGLLGMRERAELIGGTFEITGERGKGTVVRVRLPLPDASSTTRSTPPDTRRRTLRRQP
jgi:PAS domain S-box-containing protein